MKRKNAKLSPTNSDTHMQRTRISVSRLKCVEQKIIIYSVLVGTYFRKIAVSKTFSLKINKKYFFF